MDMSTYQHDVRAIFSIKLLKESQKIELIAVRCSSLSVEVLLEMGSHKRIASRQGHHKK